MPCIIIWELIFLVILYTRVQWNNKSLQLASQMSILVMIIFKPGHVTKMYTLSRNIITQKFMVNNVFFTKEEQICNKNSKHKKLCLSISRRNATETPLMENSHVLSESAIS